MILKKDDLEFELLNGSKKSDINLVYIHGSGCDKRFLRALADQTNEYDCYLLDLPGHGGSDDTGYTVDNYINSIYSFVKDLKNVILIGHSLGGTLALSVLSKKLPAIKGSIIISSTANFYKLDKTFMEKIHAGIIDMNYLIECTGNPTDPLAIEAISYIGPPKTIIKDFLIDEMVNVEDCLKDINVPTIIITGEDEILTLVEYSEYLNKHIKGSELIIFPNERHMLPITQREQIGKIIMNLTASIDKAF